MIRDIKVLASSCNVSVWITPEDLRKIAAKIERKAAKSEYRYGAYCIGTNKSGKVLFQYRRS